MTKYINTGNKDTRSGFGEGLLAIGRECQDVVALAADLKGSVKMDGFAKEFPDRFFQAGIAEANMINVAAGLSLNGKIPFVGTFAAFATGRVYDQVRMAVAYSETNVKIAASHAGITLGEDGATHQILEDIGLMRMLPGMSVVVPCDFNQRFGRPSVPNFTPEDQAFEIGKAYKLNDGKDVSIFATGHLVWEALLAAEELEKEGIAADVINIATIKPLDYDTVMESVKKTGCVVTAEEHFIFGGMGEMIAGLLSSHMPAPVEFVAIADRFGQSGTPSELMKAYGLDAAHIVSAARRAVARK